MSFAVLDDFKFYSEVPVGLIDKYENQIPPELLEIWRSHGFGSFANGYIKIINPDEYADILNSSYYACDVAIPIFATGFADIITWEEDRFLGLVQYRKVDATIYPLNFVHFLSRFYSSQCVVDFLDNTQYSVAVKILGKLKYDECFGYVPLLALGGSEKVEKLHKMKIIPHIELITDMVGRIT
jgi:hypothetical protein